MWRIIYIKSVCKLNVIPCDRDWETHILDLIKPSILIRIKANLQPITPNIIKHQMHNDELSDHAKITTGIFYVNTNNGKTIFNTGEEINSEENKYVEFDSTNYIQVQLVLIKKEDLL